MAKKTAPKTLREYMNQYTNVTLTALAKEYDIQVAALRAQAKQPVPGKVYDPADTNYEAIEAYLNKRRLGVSLKSLDWDKMNTPTTKRSKLLTADELNFAVGQRYYLRYYKANFEIVYETETHIVLLVTDGSSTQPKVMAKATLTSFGVKPYQESTNVDTEEGGEENV